MKRLISLLMLVIMIAGIMPIAVSAEEKGVDVIHFEDGSYMTVEVISGRTRASQSLLVVKNIHTTIVMVFLNGMRY